LLKLLLSKTQSSCFLRLLYPVYITVLMLCCFLCNDKLSTISALRVHLQKHCQLGELKFPVKCMQRGCKSSFSTLFNFVRHLKSYHKCDETYINTVSEDTLSHNSTEDVLLEDVDVPLQPIHSKCNISCLEAVQSEGCTLLASLRASSCIPYSVIPKIIDSCDTMISLTIDGIQTETMKTLADAGVSDDIVSSVENAFRRQSDTLSHALDPLSTKYKQDQYFDNHRLAVKPETITLGQRYETKSNVTRLVYDTYQYISVESTLRSLLVNPQYVELLHHDKYTPHIISDCWDGTLYRQHPLLADGSKCTIAIQLFYDGMGTTNPLRGQSSMCNVGVFYFIVKNLPNAVNSCFANVHLVALCYSCDLKTYGFENVLHRFVSEMKQLSTCGFNCLGIQIYVSLVQVACDNLALNSLLGFTECFSADYFCTMCYATQEDIQCKFYESEFDLRTESRYRHDIAVVASGRHTSLSYSHGVKKECVLNEIPNFHVTRNFSLDIMHIVLEGIVQVELSCILYNLCTVKHYLTYDELSAKIVSFWSAIDIE